MGRLLLSLAIFLISTSAVAAQVQFRGCFADQSCTTFVMEGPSSNAEDCCVNNNAGLYYNDGGQCTLCIVYGWGSDTFTRPEAQFPYDFPLAYFKGPPDAQLRMAIDYNGEGTALEGEFGIGQSVVSLPLNPGGTTSITFQADRVALEPDETFVLELTLLGVENTIFERFFDSSLSNVFFRNRQEFIIQESTAIVFRLRESDRVVDEGDASISIEVTVANEVELASDISLLLTPMIAPEDFTPLPATRPFARANTIEGRIDFFTTPITLNFMAGGEILLAGDVLIYDDLIDEALEYFVVTLTFQDPDNLPPLASIESNSGDIIRIDIVDNDDIFIGFALPSTTYPEVEADHQIRIIKGAGNVTEQTISFLVNLFQTAPPGLGTATPLDDEEDNDFFIPLILLSIEPEENDTFTDVSIFADELPEVTEAAQLRLSLPTDGVFPVFKTLPQYPSFFIIIADDDSFRIGFERTSYIVNEGIGMLEVCVRILEPPEGTRISVSIGVETVRGTADGSDYREMSGSDAAFVLFFDDVVRRSCINVEITEDNRYEFEEQFSLQLIDLPGFDLPSNYVFDPPTSTIVIRGAPFGGCYSNSACSGKSLGPSNAEDCCVSSAGTYFSDETTCFQCIVYGWSSNNFPASEAQSPYSIPLVYSKGPAAQIVFTVNDTSKGTATQNVDYIQNQQVVTLSLNAGATVSVTFLIDTIAFEPDETFVLELSVTSITPAASVPLLDASLINVFFQRRQNFIIQDSAVQAQFTGCFTDPDCATAVVGGPSSNSEDCCVSNNAGLYYNQGGQCFQCIVYGFGSDTFTRPESQIPYDVPFAYFKGPSNAQLRMAIDYNGEGTASEEEFGISQSVVTLPLNPGETTSITFQADRVALEPDETFVLELSLLGVANGVGELFDSSLPNVFFQSRQEFIIQDSTALVFRLRESDRIVDEGNRFIPIDVTVSNEVELASDISLVLTPMIAPDDFRPLPTTRPFTRANTNLGRTDFFTHPITLNFMAGGEILLAGDVLIYDDLIDEALEYFVVTLTFQDTANVPPLASIESDIIRIDIVDDDDIFIGFALPNTTYPEEEADHQIQIIKGAGNVTEQTISFVVNLFQTTPEGLVTATPSADGEDNDFLFPSSSLLSIGPEENHTFAELTIFEEDLPEETEAAQLRLSLPTDGMFPGFKTLPQYPSFFIIIEDDDRFRIGFEQTSYRVYEGNSSFGFQFLQVCVRMYEPSEDTPLGPLTTLDYGVETVQGSADEDDFSEMTGNEVPFFLFFSDTIRRSCFRVVIEDDALYESEEQFSLRFIALQDFTIPDLVIDPSVILPYNVTLDPPGSSITILDDEEVTVGFINLPYSAREDEGPMIFTVGVTSRYDIATDIELSFSTADNLISRTAAMAGQDYTSIINMPIILRPGMQTIQIAVNLTDDQLIEINEVFRGTLSLVTTDRVSLGLDNANATIIEDERFLIGFENTSYTVNEEGEFGFSFLEVCVRMFEPSDDTPVRTLFRIGVETVQGTADGDDYTEMTGSDVFPFILTFTDTIRRSCIRVVIEDDALYESEEQFSLRFIALQDLDVVIDPSLLLPYNVVLDPPGSSITILDDEEVTVGFINPPYSAREDEGPMIFTVGVTGRYDIGTDVELSFSTADGLITNVAAMAGLDYTSIINMPIILSAGMQSIDIPVDLINDPIFDNFEMFRGILSLVTTDRVSLSLGTADATIIDSNATLTIVNDTVSGDPLFSVPLNVPDKTLIMNVGDNDPINLCFEVHGDDGGLFNLVSDACVSVNARYARVLPNEDINIVDAIYVRTIDANGNCRNIEVSLDQCSASIDDIPVRNYVNAGITVRRFRNRVRIVAPNCADIDLVMWVSCLNSTFWSRASTDQNEIIFHANNIRFVIARGLNLAERSHGLLGQFWNVPIQVQPYTGPVRDGVNSNGYYVITTNHPNEPQRSFVGRLWPLTWESKKEYCLYAGQRQAGAPYEILDDTVNSPVIFGEYTDYRVETPYATDFSYTHFEESRCA